jgi:transcriptional regulator with XRE-family HTH domain
MIAETSRHDDADSARRTKALTERQVAEQLGLSVATLSEHETSKAAMEAPAVHVLTDLRNALAHGGIAYLDERGRQTGGEAAMMAFVGAVMKGNRITAANVLRVGEQDYRKFLSAWASWLRRSGVSAALTEWAA